MSHGQNNGDDTHGDEWKALQKELFGEEADEEADIQFTGDLVLPQSSSRTGKTSTAKAQQTKKAKPAPKAQKAKQKTLAQSISDVDMEHILGKYRDDEEDDGDVDISKYLQDEFDDDDGDDDSSAGPVGATDFMAALTNQKTVLSMDDLAVQKNLSTEQQEQDSPSEPAVHISLEDAPLAFEAPAAAKKSGKRGVSPTGTKETYVKAERGTEAIQMSSQINTAPAAIGSQPGSATKIMEPLKEGSLYWLDAKEQPHSLSVEPGSIFLFGRLAVQEGGKTVHRSCCVRVQNAYRCIYLLPKPGATDMDVLKEINDVCRKQGIEQRRVKFVERYYAFEDPDVPQGKSRWAKLRYPGRFPALQKISFENIEHMMGATTSLLETFLIKRKMKGPSYLRIQDLQPVTHRISHCELEFTIDTPKKITIDDTTTLRAPPLTLASIQLHAQLDEKGASNEVFVASVAVYRDVNVDGALKQSPENVFTGVRPLAGKLFKSDLPGFCRKQGLPGIVCFQNEALLLKWLAQLIQQIDPDMLVGHNFLGYTVDTLLRRYQEFDTPGWSSLGRLDHKRFPRLQGTTSMFQEKEVCVGRLVVDSYLLSREYFKSVDYKLTSLASQMKLQGLIRGDSSFEAGNSVLTEAMMSSDTDLFSVLAQVCNCTALSAGVISHLDVIRLTKRLTSIAGNLWSRTLTGARSERVEYLLLHTFHDLKFINPDKKMLNLKRGRDENEGEVEGKRKAKYQGGMVLEPKCGLYTDFILLLDFNSLYPSLIQEFNICFTTVDRQSEGTPDIPPPESLICETCAAAGLPSPCLHKCVLPKVIKSLVDSRREVKRLMKTEKDTNNLALLEIRQKALKITANSMYGCLGFEHSRFHAQQLAELVTRQGRLALQNTVDLIPQIHPSLRVIYGDTDSVMIQTGIKTDIKAVRDLGYELKAKVNKKYQSLEIDIDGVFRAILLLRKKKYAALTVEDWQGDGKVYKREVKGLDMVRRDWCPLSKQVSEAVLNRILNAEGGEDSLDYIMTYMQKVAENVRQGKTYPLSEFVISKSLTKEPEAYQTTAFPHAAVALRMKQNKKLVRVGDLIPYVICDGDKLSEKAHHVEEVLNDKSLRLDAEWYLTSQIYPPVMRLCEQIQGFSAAQLSEAMGIAHHERARAEADDNGVNDFNYSGMFKSRELSDCFSTAVKLQVPCTHCFVKTPIDPHQRVEEVLAGPSPDEPFDLYVCNSCRRSLAVPYVANCFTQKCYSLLRDFYESGGGPPQVRQVRVQFTYFRALFDVPHAPGCPPRVKYCHRFLARRCLGMDRKLYTLDQAANPVIAEAQDPVDPLLASAETFYKRIENMFVNLDSLFS